MNDDRGLYPISLYPGQSKIIQLLTLDDFPFVLPTGTVAISRAIDVLQDSVATLPVTIENGTQGLIKIVLPDTELVRSYWQRKVFYDVRLTIDGAFKYLPLSELDIQFSAAGWTTLATATPPTNTNTTNPPGNPAIVPPATNPSYIYKMEEYWVNDQGKKVQVTIERQANGNELFKLTEVLP